MSYLTQINCDIRLLLIIYIDDLNVNDCLKTRLIEEEIWTAGHDE